MHATLAMYLIMLVSAYPHIDSRSDFGEYMSVIVNFLDRENLPSRVIGYVCCSIVEKMDFVKIFSKHGYAVAFSNNAVRFKLPEHHQVFLLDTRCGTFKHILDEASHMKQFDHPFRWIIMNYENNNSIFDNYYFGVGSRVYLINQVREGYYIKSIYKISTRNQTFKENHIAMWNNITGFIEYNQLVASRNRSNLEGLLLTLSYVASFNDTLLHIDDYRNPHINSMTKVNYLVLPFLFDIVNATAHNIFRATYGYKNTTTGKYGGVMGDLQSGLTELGGQSLIITLDRLEQVDFIAATAETAMGFIFKAPPLSYVANVFTLPFDTNVWYCCYAMLGLTFIILYIITLWEWHDPIFRKKIDDKPHIMRAEFSEVLTSEVGYITQQGSDTEPASIAGRISIILSLLIFMFLYTSYSANIVALLQSTDDNINTVNDLLTSRISLGVEDLDYDHYYIETAEGAVRKAIYERKIAPKGQKPNFMGLEEGMRRVREEFFGFHTELNSGYKIIADTFHESEKCGLREIEFVKIISPWLPVRKNSSYREIFKVGMYRLRETGIQKRVSRRIYLKKPVCLTKGSNFVSVGLLDCYGAFMIFAVGLACSLFIFLTELIWKKYLDETYLSILKKYKDRINTSKNLFQVRPFNRDQIQY